MMKKLLLLAVLAVCQSVFAQFPSVGILGAATPLGWSGDQPDIAMQTTDGIYYTLTNMPLYSGGLKFRQDNSWPLNWGHTDWPSGTAVQDQGGMDVPVVVGVYDISFNLETKEYNFVYKFPVIGVRGAATAVTWDSASGDILFNTTDGETYTYHNLSLTTNGLKFRQDNDWPNNWGGDAWPTGTGIFNQDGVDIQAVEGIYDVTFNRTTLAYSFVQVFPAVGIIGAATTAGWDGADIDMATTDGITYTLDNVTLTTGGLKFRLDDEWPNNWGGTEWPTGTGIFNQDGVDIPCQAGVYNIIFNLTTLVYNFEEQVTGTDGFSQNIVTLYPNPAHDVVTLTSGSEITHVSITDVSGKTVAVFEGATTLDVSGLSSGLYFVQVNSQSGVSVTRLVKK